MPILALETSTKNCSVALMDGDTVLAFRDEVDEQYAHAERLNLIIASLMEEAGVAFKDLKAIAVGRGPGSYTGLRIGVSSAKGFAYQLGIPLLSFESLQPLVEEALTQYPEAEIVLPMIDARRMEVFTQCYKKRNAQGNIEAIVLDQAYFEQWDAASCAVLVGDGAAKCASLIEGRPHWHILPTFPKAKTMAAAMHRKLELEHVEDVAYFEPFYLKEFIAGKPKKAFQ